MEKIHVIRNGIALTVWPNGLKTGDVVHVDQEKEPLVIESIRYEKTGAVVFADGREFPVGRLV